VPPPAPRIQHLSRHSANGEDATAVNGGTPVSGTSFVDTGLVNGQTYFYIVTAVNGAGQSPNSSEVSATPATAPTALNVVGGSGQIVLNWTASAGATSYNIYRGHGRQWRRAPRGSTRQPLLPPPSRFHGRRGRHVLLQGDSRNRLQRNRQEQRILCHFYTGGAGGPERRQWKWTGHPIVERRHRRHRIQPLSRYVRERRRRDRRQRRHSVSGTSFTTPDSSTAKPISTRSPQ